MKRRYCRLFSLLVLAVLLLAVPTGAYALGFFPGIPQLPQGEITEIDPVYIPTYGVMTGHSSTLFEAGCAPQDILDELPKSVDGIIGETGDYAPCDVAWAAPDTSVSGWISVVGTLSPPPGCTLAQGLKTITYPVMINEDGMQNAEPLEKIFTLNAQNESYLAQLLPQGSDLSSLSILSLSAIAICGNHLYYALPIDWDLSFVNTSVPGEYKVLGTPRLPSCFSLPNGFTAFEATVYIGAPSGIDLSAVTQKSMSSVTSEWIETIPDPENIRLFYSETSQDGPFTQDSFVSKGEIAAGTRITTDHAWYTGNKLSISLGKLKTDQPYYFYLEYNGVKSNLLTVTAKESTLPAADGIGGDRDGGDRQPQITPVPTPSPSPTPAPSAPADGKAPAIGAEDVHIAKQHAAPAQDFAVPEASSSVEPSPSASPQSSAVTSISESTAPAAAASSQPTQPSSETKSSVSDMQVPGTSVFPWQLVIIFAAAAVILAALLIWRYVRHGSR